MRDHGSIKAWERKVVEDGIVISQAALVHPSGAVTLSQFEKWPNGREEERAVMLPEVEFADMVASVKTELESR